MTSHTGPVIFSDETARNQLTTHGKVVTFRTDNRTTGPTWWRKTRTGEKQGDCYVTLIKPTDPSDTKSLEPFCELSGFNSVTEWQDAIKNLNGDLTSGYLYAVRRIEGD